MAEPGPDAVPIQKPLVYRLPTTGIMAVGGPSETLSGEALCGLVMVISQHPGSLSVRESVWGSGDGTGGFWSHQV